MYDFRTVEHTKNHEPSEEEWGEFATQARKEKGVDKITELGERVVEKFDETQQHKGPGPL